MKPSSKLRRFLLLAGSTLLATASAHAADGTWNGITGTWTDTTDPGGVWSGGTIADGADSTAYFTGLDIVADQTITLGVNRAIGNITFTDATTSSNNLTITGNTLTLDRTVGVPVVDVTQADRQLTLSSTIAGNDGLQKNGDGILTLTGANTFSGTTTISAGTLSLVGTAFSTTARAYSISSGAVLSLDAPSGIASGTTRFSGVGTLCIVGNLSNDNIGRKITMGMGAGSTIDIQSGGQIYNGGWQNITWTTNKATLNVDGELNFADGNPVFANALTGGGSITKSGTSTKTLTLGVDDGSGTFSGTISNASGSIALTKNGTGTQTLSNDNTYTGATTVSAGTLLINGSTGASGAVSVASGATLGGSGTVGGATSLSSGGKIAPGASNTIGALAIGTSLVNKNFTWNAGGVAQFQLGASNNSDHLNIFGNLTKSGTGTFAFDFLNSTSVGTFTLATWTGTTDFTAADFSFTNYAPGGAFSITAVSNGSLLFTAAPEHSTALGGRPTAHRKPPPPEVQPRSSGLGS